MGHSEGEKIRKTILHRDVALMCARENGLTASESAHTWNDGHIIGGEKFIFIFPPIARQKEKNIVYTTHISKQNTSIPTPAPHRFQPAAHGGKKRRRES